ncbi:MAG TPA: ammonia-dependent NAD(+) synthetase [Nevskiaceae bacterium]
MTATDISVRQAGIAAALHVVPPFASPQAAQEEAQRRVAFIAKTLRDSGQRTLVLGISGGIDSALAARLAQLAVESLRTGEGAADCRFIAVRLPYGEQFDEGDAQLALRFIRADEERTVPIKAGVDALCNGLGDLAALPDARRDFVIGNVKARVRMVAQFAIANATHGLVIGTDHAAEAVMGFFTKFGDGAADLTPLAGLVKGQIRAIAAHLGAPARLVDKVPTADLEALRPGRPDEDAYGVTYAEIDAFLHGEPVSEAAATRIIQAYDASRHKRRLPLTP